MTREGLARLRESGMTNGEKRDLDYKRSQSRLKKNLENISGT